MSVSLYHTVNQYLMLLGENLSSEIVFGIALAEIVSEGNEKSKKHIASLDTYRDTLSSIRVKCSGNRNSDSDGNGDSCSGSNFYSNKAPGKFSGCCEQLGFRRTWSYFPEFEQRIGAVEFFERREKIAGQFPTG